MQDARAIANFILKNFDPDAEDLTNLKMNKIIYFLHGWYLVRKNMPLIRNHIEAWQHGPVIKVVYDSFKHHGDRPINRPAKYFNYATEKEEVVKFDDRYGIDERFLCHVSKFYMKFSASELRNLTHKLGGPWDQIFHRVESTEKIQTRVPNETIREYFILLSESGKTH